MTTDLHGTLTHSGGGGQTTPTVTPTHRRSTGSLHSFSIDAIIGDMTSSATTHSGKFIHAGYFNNRM